MPFNPYPLSFPGGIQRDGTEFDAVSYTDGTWCRMQRGRPRKIGGYQTLTQGMTGISRALHTQNLSGFAYVHSGFAAGVEQYTIDNLGFTSAPAGRTPVGFTSSPNNIWQFASMFDETSNAQQIFAFVVPGLTNIDYGTQGNLYGGNIYNSTALTAVTAGILPEATGGIMAIPPYLCVYGTNGFIQWSVAGFPYDFVDFGSGAANVAAQKIVRGLPLRGGGSFSPGALLWTLDAVVRMYFIGGAPVFAFDQVGGQSSILSHNSVVDVDGVYYWAGVDRFLRYNGYIQEVPNDKNINFFFDNLNRAYAQKAFAFKLARYGEVWFCAPLFMATECNWAVIYNYRENLWYDTPLPNSGRSFAIPVATAPGVYMAGVDLYNASTYRLWNHEVGTDEVDGAFTRAINSTFTTPIISAATFQQPIDKTLHVDAIEPDMIQTGNMTVNVFTRGTAQGPFTQTQAVSFGPRPEGATAQYVPLHTSGKQMKFQFVSNVAGGTFQAGKDVAYVSTDAGRRTQ